MEVQSKKPLSSNLEVFGNGLLFAPRTLFRTTAKVAEIAADLCTVAAPFGVFMAADSLISSSKWSTRTILSRTIYGPKLFDVGWGYNEEQFVAHEGLMGLMLCAGTLVGGVVASRFSQLCNKIADDLAIQPRNIEQIENKKAI